MPKLGQKSIIMLLCTLFHLLYGSAAFAQSLVSGDKVRISGFVMDSQKKALDLVNIYEQNTHFGCSTDENGYYELELPAKDTLLLRFSCLSYQTAYRIVPVEMKHLSLNVVLQNSSHKLQDVSVTEQRRQLNSLQRIDAEDIRLLPDP